MFKVDNNDIFMYSGEDGLLTIELEDVEIVDGDYAIFSARAKDNLGTRGELLTQFIVAPEEGNLLIFPFPHEDTEEYPPGTYSWQVELILSSMHRAMDIGDFVVSKAVRQE